MHHPSVPFVHRRAVVRVAAILLMAATPACSDESSSPRAAPTPAKRSLAACGIPTPEPHPELERVPPQLILDGEVVRVIPDPDLDTTLIAHEGTVKSLQDAYREAVPKAGFKVVQEDYEGFEAELYLSRGEEIGFVKLLETECRDVTMAGVKLG